MYKSYFEQKKINKLEIKLKNKTENCSKKLI